MKKRSKILAAAIALIGFSTAASITGTVAWFTASNVVSATGMNIQAEAEQGILIANETHSAASDWKASVEASHSGAGYTFIPTSTYHADTWYHANSSSFDQAQGGQTSDKYLALSNSTDISINGSGTGVYKVSKTGEAITGKNLYLLNSFFIKSSAAVISEDQTLYVNEVNAAIKDGATAVSADLNKSLRVLVNYDTEYLWFAPFEATSECTQVTVGGTANTYTPIATGVKNSVLASDVDIPANDTNSPLEIKTYIYFEGEDANCKSANIKATLDMLVLDFKFGTQTVA